MSMMSSAFSFQVCGRESGNSAKCDDDMIYFAVGSDAQNSWPNLSWVARNFAGQKISFLHVLQPTKMIPSKNAPRDGEKQRIQEILKNYHRMLSDVGLEGGGEITTKMEKVEEGIVKLVSHHKIKNLVMGAAATRELVYFESKITEYVSANAPASCQIWFVHNGHLIKTRYDQMSIGGSSKKETSDELLRLKEAEKESMEACRKETSIEDALALDWSEIFGSSSSQPSVAKFPSAPPVADLSHGGDEILMPATARPKEMICNSSPQYSVLNEGTVYDEQLEQAMTQVDNSKREAFEESSRCRKAEKDALEASRRAKAYGWMNMALGEKSLLEDEIADFKKDNKELTQKIAELTKSYMNERDELKAERDRAIRASEEMMKHSSESSRSNDSCVPQLLSEFSYSEIEDATCHFNPCLKIDERGGCWIIYKGVLHHTEVAIKLFNADSSKCSSEYRKEVEALSRLKHPHIVTLIGACPEALAIIYEHIPNGSLEDRLNCRNNSSPLPWQTRICIAAELCSVLIFLKSHCIVHGDLKPANILLDANFNVKLSHFGLSHAMTTADHSTPKSDVKMLSKLLSRIVTLTAANGGSSPKPSDTFVYMDLESVITKEYTAELDVYSFGIILLRLLTGREGWGITKEVQLALDNGNLDSMLDCLAGDWPYVPAQQLAKIALRCSDVSRKNRPDLKSEVLGVLQKMKAWCQGSCHCGSELHSQAPPYYICPITQDVMQDPHVAADGFTYEKEGIQGWLYSGHDTSPLTNLKLEHTKLVPNRALRSAIQEWTVASEVVLCKKCDKYAIK